MTLDVREGLLSFFTDSEGLGSETEHDGTVPASTRAQSTYTAGLLRMYSLSWSDGKDYKRAKACHAVLEVIRCLERASAWSA